MIWPPDDSHMNWRHGKHQEDARKFNFDGFQIIEIVLSTKKRRVHIIDTHPPPTHSLNQG
jgi:hypothetical protein